MTDTDAPSKPALVTVWDPLIRIGHWVLLAAVAIALITRGEPELLHQGAGYVIAAYVVWRVVWGIAGPQRARFDTFVRSPIDALRYLADLVGGKAKRHVGHSPAGGWMVIALLVTLSGTVATGLAMENRVPVPAFMAPLVAQAVGERAEFGEAAEAGEREESPWEEVHEAFANLVLALALLHVAGVAVASFAHRENLTRSMIDGRKHMEE
jgi:cytochrome b